MLYSIYILKPLPPYMVHAMANSFENERASTFLERQLYKESNAQVRF